jgi:hypothetical protein
MYVCNLHGRVGRCSQGAGTLNGTSVPICVTMKSYSAAIQLRLVAPGCILGLRSLLCKFVLLHNITAKVGTSFANKRRPLGRYSSLADYKPRSLVFFSYSLSPTSCTEAMHTVTETDYGPALKAMAHQEN